MGTQQILLIVLSVIIVGVAIAVGITMFGNQAYNGNQQAVASELQNYGSQCIQFYKTPKSQGGAGQDAAAVSADTVAIFLGFTGAGNTMASDNGTFQVTSTSGTTVVLTGKGKELKRAAYPMVTTTVELEEGTITSVVSTSDTNSF